MEWYIEGLTIFAPKAQSAFQWQLVQNIGITDTTLAFHKLFDNTYRIHYLVVSLLLILLVTDMVYSYGRLISSKDRPKKNILYLQFFLTGLFILLYIVSNIPYILGESADFITQYSSVLTISFFSLAGVVSGVYLAGFLINFNRWISVLLPAAAACLTNTAMYNEYKMVMEFCMIWVNFLPAHSIHCSETGQYPHYYYWYSYSSLLLLFANTARKIFLTGAYLDNVDNK